MAGKKPKAGGRKGRAGRRRKASRGARKPRPSGADLVEAVGNLDRPRVESLLRARAPLEAGDEQGRTPLMIAALHGEPGLVRILLDAGADANAQTGGAPAQGLGSAAARSIAEREGDEHRTPLSFGVESGELEVVETLLACGANPYNAGATTPLDLAVLGGDAEIVRALLEAGADPNGRDSEGDTPLMLAAAAGDAETIEALLEMGASASARNDDGDDALRLAALARQPEAVEALAAHFPMLARWSARRALRRRGTSSRRTREAMVKRLHQDALQGRLAAVRKALACGVPADAVRASGDGSTPLFAAARGGHVGVIRELVDAGADPNLLSQSDTPLTVALGPGVLDPRARSEVVRALVAAGADLEGQDADGLTPLMRAVVSAVGDEAVVVALLELGADPCAEHLSGLTAVELARQDPSKARIVECIEGFRAKTQPLARSAGREVRAGARRPHADAPVETLRGLGNVRISEVVCAVRAPIDAVAPALEALRGGRQWSRGVYTREGLFVGEEGYLVYQLRDHDWTLVQTDLLDARALGRRDARALSERLACDAVHYEVCDTARLLSYSVFRDGEGVERLRAGAAVRGGKGVVFASTLEPEAAPGDEILAFVDSRFAALDLFVPGLGDDRLAWIEREFEPEDFERVDFLRVDAEGSPS